jgi:hypothetical protein
MGHLNGRLGCDCIRDTPMSYMFSPEPGNCNTTSYCALLPHGEGLCI